MNICIFFIFLSWLHEDKQQFSMKNICPRELQDSLDWNIFAIEVQTLNVGVVICKMYVKTLFRSWGCYKV